MRTILSICLSACLISRSLAAFDLGFHDDSDLTNFVTRPDIKAPLFNFSFFDDTKVSQGYIFIAPYGHIKEEKHARKYYQPCQTGPMIYDRRGNLVWSGACLVKNRNTCDFRAWSVNNTFLLSGLLTAGPKEYQGHGFLMDNSYRMIDNVKVPPPMQHFNMHEMNLIDNGRTALHVINKPITEDLTGLNTDYDSGWVLDMGFREVDVTTGKTLFTWWAREHDHVRLAESAVKVQNTLGPPPSSWDWFHANAVDKNEEGDYLFCGRHADTIYKISGRDGSVIWRLGGTNSSFVHQSNFNFSRQHDARFQGRTGNKEYISFLDNASDLDNRTSDHSSALLVELDMTAKPPTALVSQRIIRPDGQLTRSRGNYQRLTNGHSFVGWSDNAYISEHDSNGQLLMEARFQSRRFTTYRSYKANYTGLPWEPPAIKAFAYGITPSKSTTIVYVSWNGATEINTWRFHGWSGREYASLGEKKKTGFETFFQAEGYFDNVFAEAIAADGSSLGASPLEIVVQPEDWVLQAGLPSDRQLEEELKDLNSRPKPAAQQTHGLLRSGLSTNVPSSASFAAIVVVLLVAFGLRYFVLRRRNLARLRRGIGESLIRSISPTSKQ